MVGADGAVGDRGQSDVVQSQRSKIGHKRGRARHGEAARVFSVTIVPIDEVEARVGHGSQGTGSVLIEFTAACDGTRIARVGRCGDGVLRAAHDADGTKIGLILLASDDHIEGATARDGIGEVHGGHTRRVGLGNAVDDRAVVGDGDVRTCQSVNGDGCGTRGDGAWYRNGVHFWFGDVRHHGTIAKGVVELEVIVGRVVAVARSDATVGVVVGNGLLHSEIAKIQQ